MLNKLPHPPDLVGPVRCAPTSVHLYQKQLKINHQTLLPKHIPDEDSYKRLSMLGPRRVIDSKWVKWTQTTDKTSRTYRICKPKPSDQTQCNAVISKPLDLNLRQEDVDDNNCLVWTPSVLAILPTFAYGYVFPEGEQPFQLLTSTRNNF